MMNGEAEPANPATVGALVRALVEQHVPPSRHDATLSVAMRLLESSLTTAPSMQSFDTLTRSMSFRLMRDGRDEDARQLVSLTTSLKFDRAVAQHTLWPLLYILNDLRALPNTRATHSSMPSHPAPQPRIDLPSSPLAQPAPPSPALSSPPRTQPPDLFPSIVNPETPIAAINHNDTVAVTTTTVAKTTPAVVPSSLISMPMSRTTPATSVQNRSLEHALVQDLLLVVQGEDGQRVTFDREGGDDASVKLQLPAGVELPLPMHDMVHCIAELGFLFRVIRTYVSSSSMSEGIVAQNLFKAVDRELDTYFRSLVTLRDSARSSSVPPSIVANGPGQDDRYNFQVVDDTLTLRKLFVWSERERFRLRWLARLCEETRPLRGGQIVAHLRSRRGSYVSTDIRDMMSRIVACTAAPLNMMLVRWLSEGVLPDPHGEFFIMEDPRVAAAVAANPYSALAVEEGGHTAGLAGGPNIASAASTRIWWGLFKMRRDMLPGCVDATTAQKTLITGKSIAFMRRCCSDSEWVGECHGPLVQALISGGMKLFEADLKYNDNTVRDVVAKAFTSASQRLKHLFFEKFDLSHHFGAIKRYLLLSQGDFAQSLMDGLASILDSGGEALHQNLTGYVDTALQSSSSFSEDTDWDILERLDVQIELRDNMANTSGWDVFSLTYRVEDAPLNTVFSRKVMDAYLLIFRLLWRLKRMEYLMSVGYTGLREAEKRRRRRQGNTNEDVLRRKDVDRVMKRVHFLRMKITHLIQNMQHYCKVEVLEGCWAVLEREMNEAEDLDGMIVAHAKYLTMIKDMTLQSERSRYVSAELDAVLDTVPRFSRVQKEVCTWAVTMGISELSSSANSPESADDLLEKLGEIEREFDLRFRRLVEVLTMHSQLVEECVFLLFRLDFNEYYVRRTATFAKSTTAGSPNTTRTSA